MPKQALIMCEKSGIWSRALWQRGYDVLQCDLGLSVSGEVRPGWYQYAGDVRDLGDCGADVVCAFSPCTDLSKVGARLWRQKAGDGRVLAALYLLTFCATKAAGARVAGLVENPIGLAKRVLGDPSMLCDPWEFATGSAEHVLKHTCLWLYGWPLVLRYAGSETRARSFIESVAPGPDQADVRSKSWEGMASAFVASLPHGGRL